MSKSCCGTSSNPYTRDHYRELVEAERVLADLLPLIDKVDRCGVECQAFREVAKELQSRFAAIKKEFMTPAPK